MIQSKEYERALDVLNRLLKEKKVRGNDRLKYKVLLQVAHLYSKQGLSRKSARIYAKARRRVDADERPRLWLRAAVGQAYQHLRAGNTKRAEVLSKRVVRFAKETANKDKEWRAQASRVARRGGVVDVRQRPYRPSVALTKLGNAFFLQGKAQLAKRIYQSAVDMTPHGASRARTALAQVFLSEGGYKNAFRQAFRSLILGGFQVKTIANWPILIEARQRLGKSGLPSRLLKGLKQMEPLSARARTTLLVINSLRKRRDPYWKVLAMEWMAEHHHPHEQGEPCEHDCKTYTVQIQRLLLCAMRLSEQNPAAQALMARQLLANPNVRGSDLIYAAKTFAQNQTETGSLLANLGFFLDRAEELYGKRLRSKVAHAYALGCMIGKKHRVAESILQRVIEVQTRASVAWAKATWALGRMHLLFKDWVKAMDRFSAFSQNEHIPVKFRVKSIRYYLYALTQLSKQGDEQDAQGEVQEKINAALAGIQSILAGADTRTKLETARHLNLAAAQLRNTVHGVDASQWYKVRDQLIDEVVTASYVTITDEATHPTEILPILLPLQRKLFYDFYDYQRLVDLWQQLPEKLIQSVHAERPGRPLWESYMLLACAYQHLGKASETSVVTTRLNELYPNDATCQAIVALIEAWQEKDDSLSLQHYTRATELSPSDTFTAVAWHHRMMDAYKKGDRKLAKRYALALRQCYQGTAPAFRSQRQMDCHAGLVLADSPPTAQAAPRSLRGLYSDRFIARGIEYLKNASRSTEEKRTEMSSLSPLWLPSTLACWLVSCVVWIMAMSGGMAQQTDTTEDIYGHPQSIELDVPHIALNDDDFDNNNEYDFKQEKLSGDSDPQKFNEIVYKVNDPSEKVKAKGTLTVELKAKNARLYQAKKLKNLKTEQIEEKKIEIEYPIPEGEEAPRLYIEGIESTGKKDDVELTATWESDVSALVASRKLIKTVKVGVFYADIDVDSFNEKGTRSPYTSNKGGENKADEQELNAGNAQVGKWLLENAGSNTHGVPAWAAGFDCAGGVSEDNIPASHNAFVPITIHIPKPYETAKVVVSLAYDESIPRIGDHGHLEMIDLPEENRREYHLKKQGIRLWAKPLHQMRDKKDVSSGGDFVKSGAAIRWPELTERAGKSSEERTITLYAEYAREHQLGEMHQKPITLTVKQDSTASAPETKDSAFVRLLPVEVTPKGSADTTNHQNPEDCWDHDKNWFDFQGVTSKSPGDVGRNRIFIEAKVPGGLPAGLKFKWTLGAEAGTLEMADTATPKHIPPADPGEGLIKLEIVKGDQSLGVVAERKLVIYKDHLERDRYNFDPGVHCNVITKPWEFTKFGVTIKMPTAWNCHGSVVHMHNGTGNGGIFLGPGATEFPEEMNDWPQVGKTFPITFSDRKNPIKWGDHGIALKRGDVIIYQTDNLLVEHSQMVLEGNVAYGANNHWAFGSSDNLWEWWEKAPGMYYSSYPAEDDEGDENNDANTAFPIRLTVLRPPREN